MNQIYSASPEGLISEFITKFESGKNMLDAVLLKQHSREGFKILRQAVTELIHHCITSGYH